MTEPQNNHGFLGFPWRRGSGLRLGIAAGSALAAAVLTAGVAQAANITGTDGPDALVGTPQNDVIRALGGNDRAEGRGGNDRINGGAGRDALIGEAGNDLVDGGADDDTAVSGGDGNDAVYGGAGDDTVDGDAGNDLMRGGAGDDTLFGGDGDDAMFGDAGEDEVFGGEGNDQLNGGAGPDELEGEEGADRTAGGAGIDQFNLFTSAFQPDSTFAVRDVVLDFQGAGRAGGDVLQLSGGEFAWVGRINAALRVGAVLPGGGDGLTQLGYLQSGGDTFLIADTDDGGRLDADDFTVRFRGAHAFTPGDFDNTSFIIAGTNGDDVITGTDQADRIFAAGGDDEVRALGGDDEAHGGEGNDFLDGGPGGFDNLFGEDGDDELTLATSDGGGVASGGDGNDLLFGSDTSFGNFDNNLQGDAGNDDLRAGAVGSSLNGGGGSDRLVSSAADDQLEAGRDESGFDLDNAPDLFVYTGTGRWSAEDSPFGDIVSGFQDGSDRFDLRGSGLQLSDLTILNEDFQTTISSGRGTITIFESSGQEVFVDGSDFLF